jgi:hypothetical protein
LENYDSIFAETGNDKLLANGRFFESPSHRNTGHPFLLSEDYQNGSIKIHDKLYTNCKLKYNIFNQNIVLLYSNSNNVHIPIVLPNDFISEFSINDAHFKKLHISGKEQFYQIVYTGNIDCIYEWYKKRKDSFQNGDYSSYAYSEAQKKCLIILNGSSYEIKRKRDIYNLFPEEYKNNIKEYIKKNKMKFKHLDVQAISALISFCDDMNYVD